MKEVIQKCRELGSEVFKIYKKLVFERKEFEVSKEFLISGTSIGASYTLFHPRLACIKLDETRYWITLLKKTRYIYPSEYKNLMARCDEIESCMND
ncbi:MAG: four helix bundle protein [Treponema sp.]|nr:four helix bundle protein [Treponema sp.]